MDYRVRLALALLAALALAGCSGLATTDGSDTGTPITGADAPATDTPTATATATATPTTGVDTGGATERTTARATTGTAANDTLAWAADITVQYDEQGTETPTEVATGTPTEATTTTTVAAPTTTTTTTTTTATDTPTPVPTTTTRAPTDTPTETATPTATETPTATPTATTTTTTTDTITTTPEPTTATTHPPIETATAAPTTTAEPTPSGPEFHNFGATATAGQFSVSVSDALNQGTYDGLASPGHTILEVTVSVTNTGETPRDAPYWGDFPLLMDTGDGNPTQYEPLNVGSFGYATVQPGATYEGTVLYDVSTPFHPESPMGARMEVIYTASEPAVGWAQPTGMIDGSVPRSEVPTPSPMPTDEPTSPDPSPAPTEETVLRDPSPVATPVNETPANATAD